MEEDKSSLEELIDVDEEITSLLEEEVETFDEPAINDFKDTLKKVFTMWDEMFKEK